jgi:hypothetical protein
VGDLGTAAVSNVGRVGRVASVPVPSFVAITRNPEVAAKMANASDAGSGTGTTQTLTTTTTTTTAAEKQKQKKKQKQQQLHLSASYYPLTFSEKDTDWRDVIEKNTELQLRHLPKRLKGLGSTEEFMRVEH